MVVAVDSGAVLSVASVPSVPSPQADERHREARGQRHDQKRDHPFRSLHLILLSPNLLLDTLVAFLGSARSPNFIQVTSQARSPFEHDDTADKVALLRAPTGPGSRVIGTAIARQIE